jgi:adenylate cyclase
VLKSQLCFNFYIELTPEKQFLLIHDPDEIYNKRVEELERNLAKATSESLKEKIKTAIIELEYRFNDCKKETSSASSAKWKWTAAVVICALIAVVSILFIRSLYFSPLLFKGDRDQDQLSSFDLAAWLSIAVLPFDNMTGDPQQDNFSSGITEEIITTLSKLPEINVIDHNLTFLYKSKELDLQEIREKLGTHYVLQGSIRMAGERVRITAQLSDAVTGHHLWADRWDRDLYDVFAVQDDITMKIVTELVVILKAGEHARLFAKSTRNLEAFTMVLSGYHYFFEGTLDDTLRARQLCKKAIALDPEYVAAYALLADTYLKEVEQGGGKSRVELVDKAFNTIQKALVKDEFDALAHNILSRVYTFQGRLDLALAEAKKAVDIFPSSVECINWQGLVTMRLGRHEEAIKMFNRSLSLNPKDPSLSLIFLGLAHTELERYEDAVPYFEKFMLLKPKAVMESLTLSALYVAVGRDEEARAIVKKALNKDPTLTVNKVLQMITIEKEKEPSNSRQLLAEQLPKAGLP